MNVLQTTQTDVAYHCQQQQLKTFAVLSWQHLDTAVQGYLAVTPGQCAHSGNDLLADATALQHLLVVSIILSFCDVLSCSRFDFSVTGLEGRGAATLSVLEGH